MDESETAPVPAPSSVTRSTREEYMVSVRGRLGDGLLDAFVPLVATFRPGRTELCGPIEDQAALHGILAKIQNFGLELDEVKHTTKPSDPVGE